MKTVPYEDTTTRNTETHIAVDEKMEKGYRKSSNPLAEGFAASSGVRPETSASGGRVRHPEVKDKSRPDRVPDSIEEENAGLAEVKTIKGSKW